MLFFGVLCNPVYKNNSGKIEIFHFYPDLIREKSKLNKYSGFYLTFFDYGDKLILALKQEEC